MPVSVTAFITSELKAFLVTYLGQPLWVTSSLWGKVGVMSTLISLPFGCFIIMVIAGPCAFRETRTSENIQISTDYHMVAVTTGLREQRRGQGVIFGCSKMLKGFGTPHIFILIVFYGSAIYMYNILYNYYVYGLKLIIVIDWDNLTITPTY